MVTVRSVVGTLGAGCSRLGSGRKGHITDGYCLVLCARHCGDHTQRMSKDTTAVPATETGTEHQRPVTQPTSEPPKDTDPQAQETSGRSLEATAWGQAVSEVLSPACACVWLCPCVVGTVVVAAGVGGCG